MAGVFSDPYLDKQLSTDQGGVMGWLKSLVQPPQNYTPLSQMTPDQLGMNNSQKFNDQMQSMHPMDKAALATSSIPIAGDLIGLAADARMFAQEPEQRNMMNYGLAGLGALPFVPSLGMIKNASKSGPNSGLVVANRYEGGTVIGKEGDLHFSVLDNEKGRLLESGFADPSGNFYSRDEALEYAKKYLPDVQGMDQTVSPRYHGLDAKDLNLASGRTELGIPNEINNLSDSELLGELGLNQPTSGILGDGGRYSKEAYEKATVTGQKAKRLKPEMKDLRREIHNKMDARSKGKSYGDVLARDDISFRLGKYKESLAKEDFIKNALQDNNSKYWNKSELNSIEKQINLGSEYSNHALEKTKANLKAATRQLKKQGWQISHTSKNNNQVSSYYATKDGRRIRISDHELPDTPQRQHNRSMGLTGNWDEDFVISGKTSLEELLKEIE